MLEKLPGGTEATAALTTIQTYMKRSITATMSVEAGGLNSTIPIAVAAEMGLPLVDADGMGPAFPEVPMVTFTLGGISATPMVVADEKGNRVFIETIDNEWTERFARSASVEMGGSALAAAYPMSSGEVRGWSIHGTMSFCRALGRAVHEAQDRGQDPVEAIITLTDGYELFGGGTHRYRTAYGGGLRYGKRHYPGNRPRPGPRIAYRIPEREPHRKPRWIGRGNRSGPDHGSRSRHGEALTTEGLRYGLRVIVIGIPCDELWRGADGLDLVGPRLFGYEQEYVPIEELQS